MGAREVLRWLIAALGVAAALLSATPADGQGGSEGIVYVPGKPWTMHVPDPDAVNWANRQSRPGYRYRGMAPMQQKFYDYIQAKRGRGEALSAAEEATIRFLQGARRWPEAPAPNAFWRAYMQYLRNLDREELTDAEAFMYNQLMARGLITTDRTPGPVQQRVIEYLNSGPFAPKGFLQSMFGRVEPWLDYEMAASGLDMAAGGPGGNVFPGDRFNGMQITYNVTGATLGAPTDQGGFTTSRRHTGVLQPGGALSVSGRVVVGGYGADLAVRVWAGDKEDEYKVYIENKGEGAGGSFNVSVPLPAGTRTGGFSVRMDGRYSMGGGHRGLVVSAELGQSAAERNAEREAADREWRQRVDETLRKLGYEDTPEGRALKEMRDAANAGDAAWKAYVHRHLRELGYEDTPEGRECAQLQQAVNGDEAAWNAFVDRQNPAPPDIGGLQVGTGTEGGRTTGAADTLPPTPQVALAWEFQNVPAGSVAEVVWTRDGKELTRSRREVGGNGWVSFSMRAGEGNLAPGRYTATLTIGGEIVGRKTFRIGG